ncbi:hypothetical protein JCM5296_001708 [Sporobolomyces johnsonii]
MSDFENDYMNSPTPIDPALLGLGGESDIDDLAAADFTTGAARRQPKPSARAMAGAESTNFLSSSSPRTSSGASPPISRWDQPIEEMNPDFTHDPKAAPQILDLAEAPRKDCKLPCDSPPRYSFYLNSYHTNGHRDLQLESKTARDKRVKVRMREEAALQKVAAETEAAKRLERLAELERKRKELAKEARELAGGNNGGKGPKPSKGKKAEAITISDSEDPDEGRPDAEAKADTVVEFICNSTTAKEMWLKLVHFCGRRGITLTKAQAQGIWQRQMGTYKKCKQADEVTGGASGDYAEISEEAKAAFEETDRYRWIDNVAASAPNITRQIVLNQNGRTRVAATAFGSDDETPAEQRKSARQRRESDQEWRAALDLAKAKVQEETNKRFLEQLAKMNAVTEQRIRMRVAASLVNTPNVPEHYATRVYELLFKAIEEVPWPEEVEVSDEDDAESE